MANDLPTISARMITNSFTRMVISSTIIGIVISLLGLYSSYFDSSSGSTVVLIGAVAFGFSVLYAYLLKIYQTHQHGRLKHSHPHIHENEHKHQHMKKPD